jgi:peptidylprolyl isomerase
MAQAKNGDTVTVHYTGKLEDGSIFDSSINRDPLGFTIGEGQVIPGFEEAVVGMDLDETKTVKIPENKAYGPYHEELVAEVDRSQLPADLKPEVGQQLQGRQPDGQVVIATVIGVSESNVTLDANHPLAGKDLTFEIQLVAIT